MHAGKLTERVTIQIAARGRGTAGGRLTTWTDFKTVWARVQQDGAKDEQDQGQQRESKTFTVTLRSRFALSATEHRLVWTGRKFGADFERVLDIVGVTDDEVKDRTVLRCEEGRGGAG